MTVVAEQVAAAPLVGAGQTALHSHAGGGGADVQSGTVTLGDGTTTVVTFGNAFVAIPRIVASFQNAPQGIDLAYALTPSTTQVTIGVFKGHGGGNHSGNIIAWIATDA